MKFLEYDDGTRELSRAPYGARGLKSEEMIAPWRDWNGRAPYGARGLKLSPPNLMEYPALVAPHTGRVD